jgi:hypothetical protein|tara:strand:+ start:948 stop:1607 length:660 start_codon:yes stop_codon:yes gene_type:complete
MANDSTAGYGCRAVMTVGSTPATSGQSEYKLYDYAGAAFNTIFKGDPVSLNAGTQAAEKGYIQDATYDSTDDDNSGGAGWQNSADPLLVGVFNGAFYIDAGTSKPTFANSVTTGTNFAVDYNTGSSDGTAFVLDNPNQEFNMRANAAWQQNDVGLNYNTGDNGATGISGMSDERLSIATVATTSMFTLIRGANIPGQNDYASDGSDVVVMIAKASHLYN